MYMFYTKRLQGWVQKNDLLGTKSVGVGVHSPRFSDGVEVGERVVASHGLSNVVAVLELSHFSQVEVFAACDWLATEINDLICIYYEPFMQIMYV